MADPATLSPPPDSSAAPLDPNAPPLKVADDWGKELFGSDGSINHKAFEKAPDELKGVQKQWERYKTRDDLIKGWGEREKLVGQKGFKEPPGKDATPAEKTEYAQFVRKVNQAPEKIEGYGVKKPDDLPAEMWDQPYADAMLKVAHEEGLSIGAMNKLATAEIEHTKAVMESQKQAQLQWETKQQDLFREVAAKDGMDYNAAKEAADRACRRFGVAQENPLMKNASFLAAMMRVGKLLKEDSLHKGEPGDQSDLSLANLTPEAALTKANDIRDNPQNPLYEAYWQKKGPHADHDKAVKEVTRYTTIAYKNRPMRTTAQ